MQFNKKKAALFLVFTCLVIVCVILIIILLLPRKAVKQGKELEEICILKECLIMAEQIKKGQSAATSVCIPRNCVSVADFVEYGRICVLKKCLSEGKETEHHASHKKCIAKSCLTSTTQMEKLENGELCLSHDCVLTASEILKKMDTRVEPCDDFYAFSCGGFIKKNTISKEASRISSERLAEDEVSLKVREILEDHDSKDSDALKKARTVYKACLNISHSQEKSVAELKTYLTDQRIGVWPTLDPKWSDCRLDLESRMAMLNAHGVDSFFRLITEYKGINNTLFGSVYFAVPLVKGICDRAFEDDDGNLTDFALEVTKDYSEVLTRVLNLLDAHENFTTEDVEDLLRFDYKFCNATRFSRYPVKSYKTSNQTLQDLISVAPQINWSRWHNMIFRELGVTHRLDKTPIYVYNVDKSLPALVELLESTPSRTVANYLSWKFVLHHLGFLSPPFGQIVLDYRQLFAKNLLFFMDVETWTPRWKQCVNYVRRMMPIALIPSYASKVVHPELQKEMGNIAFVILKSYNETFKKTPRLMSTEKTKSIKKISNLKFRLLYPDKNKTFYNEYYEQVGKLSHSSFLDNGISLRKFQLKKLFEGVLKKSNVSNIEYLLALNDPFSASSWSDFRGNLIMLSFAAVENTGIDSKHPRYLNFGSFGTAVASEIARGFDFTSIRGEPKLQGSPKNWTTWPFYAIHFAEKRNQCFERYYLANRGGLSDGNMASIVDDIVADNQGVYASFKAYKSHVKSYGKEKYLPGLKYSDEQLFFVKYAQSWCNSESSAVYTHKMRINGALSNTEAFSDTYLCPEGKNMNPVNKCLNL